MELENTIQKRLSIRLQPNGFSFYTSSDNAQTDEEILLLQHVTTPTALATDFEEYYFTSNIPELNYDAIDVECDSSHFTLIPCHEVAEEEYCHFLPTSITENELEYIADILPVYDKANELALLYACDAVLYRFILRQMPKAKFKHRLSTQVEILLRSPQLLSIKSMCVECCEKELFVYVFEENKLLYLLPFGLSHVNDAVYFILNLFLQLSMDQLVNPLILKGEPTFVQPIHDILCKYIKQLTIIK